MGKIYRITRGLSLGKTLDEIQRYLNDLSGRAGMDPTIQAAIREIKNTYGDNVSIDEKKKSLLKFGENTAVGTSVTSIMTLPSGILHETMLTSDGITSVVSSSASDTQLISILEGHTYSSGDLSFNSANNGQNTLNGQTPVTLDTALARSTRARIPSPAVGTIYFYEGGTVTSGVPDDLDQVHLIIPAGEVQTQKASTSISSVDYWIITEATGSVIEKAASWAQFRIEIKTAAGSDDSWWPVTQWIGVSDGSGTVKVIDGSTGEYVIVPKNHDVRMVAKADGANTYCACGMFGQLAIVV